MNNIRKITNIIITIVIVLVIFVNGVILINSYLKPDEIPSFFGWKPFIVLSSSMTGTIDAGDLALIKEVEESEITENDVIAFRLGDYVYTHRVIEIVEVDGVKQYITKGDKNENSDEGHITFDEIEGEFVTKLAGVGNLAMFLQTPTGIIVSLSIPILLLLLTQFMENKEYEKQAKDTKERELEEEIQKLKKQNEELTKRIKE